MKDEPRANWFYSSFILHPSLRPAISRSARQVHGLHLGVRQRLAQGVGETLTKMKRVELVPRTEHDFLVANADHRSQDAQLARLVFVLEFIDALAGTQTLPGLVRFVVQPRFHAAV